jgi:N-acetylglutamate synthase-like GNAT family acetyltransferase
MIVLVPYTIRAVEDTDRAWVLDLIKDQWGEEYVVVHGDVIIPHLLPGYLAISANAEAIGLVTYQIRGDVCEIITLNSLIENQGVGAKLIEAVADEARRSDCRRLCLTTTNENQRAIEFYRKRGFKLKEIHKGAVDRAREIKPSIPKLSPQGIPIGDEWVFEIELTKLD